MVNSVKLKIDMPYHMSNAFRKTVFSDIFQDAFNLSQAIKRSAQTFYYINFIKMGHRKSHQSVL